MLIVIQCRTSHSLDVLISRRHTLSGCLSCRRLIIAVIAVDEVNLVIVIW